jgi:hypothetical protein
MSTVEPKQTMRQNPYTGYAIDGRIGLQKGKGVFDFFSPEVVTDEERATRSDIYPFETRDSEELLNALSYTPLGRAGSGLNILKQAGKYGTKPDFYTGVSGQARRTLEDAPFLSNQYIREALRPYASGATETLKQAGTGIKDFARKYGIATGIGAGGAGTIYGALSGDENQKQPITDQKLGLGLDNLSANFGPGISGRSEERELLEKEGVIKPPPGRKDNEYLDTDRSKPFNLLDEVKKESGELRELLGRDDDISKAEAALVLSEALGTPGTIAQKIQKGLKAAVPLRKAKAEQDKAITLTAYKLAKEKEQQQIRAGTLPTSIREAEYVAKSLKESGDPRYANMSVQQIMNENLRAAKPMSPESEARAKVLLADRETIRDTTKNLLKTKNDLDKLDPIKDKAKYDKLKEIYDSNFKEFERNYLSVPEFKSLFESTYNIFAPQITSRTMRAVGGSAEDEKEPDVIASNVNFGGTTTPIKPVQKLDYATLRDRLPKEINDQVIQLLASSEQALQDFAYITSQNDVNNFNVKYGVNLIIPPAQQTS